MGTRKTGGQIGGGWVIKIGLRPGKEKSKTKTFDRGNRDKGQIKSRSLDVQLVGLA